MFDVVVIGTGVVGSLISRELSRYNLNVLALEKENDVGAGVSNANSAIAHSGYDPVPGSLKARMNFLGNKMYPQLSKDLDFSFSQIGSLTVATKKEQLPVLEDLAKRSKENGVDVKLLNAEETLKLEPGLNPNVKGSLLAPTAGIINPFTLTIHAMENAVDNGVELHLEEEVLSIDKKGSGFIVNTNMASYETSFIINAAGLFSDKIHAMIEEIDYKIIAKKGEYFVLDHFGKYLVNHTIFPLPSEKGKGILVTPTTSMNFLIGPSSEPVEDKEDLSTDKLTLDDIKRQALELVPGIPFNHTIRVFSGLRPSPSTHDFIIGYAKTTNHFINASGIESPGLVSSPAIAKYVVEELLGKVISLKEKKHFVPLKPRINPRKLSAEQRNALIKEHPSYGKIICNCEKITLGEIEDELSRSVPPKEIKAIKKRTRAGFGKCQGGFCQPLEVMILSKHFNLPINKIDLFKTGSEIIKYTDGGEENE